MRQLFLLVSVLLLGMSWAAAQDSSQSAPNQASPSQATSGAAGQTTVEGCLSGANGSYTISDKSGTTYQLTGDTAKLSEHVGHEVKITGTSSSASASASPSASGGASSTAGRGAGGQQTLEVSSVKHVAKTCQSGAAAH